MPDIEPQQGGMLSSLATWTLSRAAWTLSSAVAVAEGTAMVLRPRFSNVKGEHAAGKDGRDSAATRVSIGVGLAVNSEGAGMTTAARSR